jgi:Protein of unknown function (DUF1499)
MSSLPDGNTSVVATGAAVPDPAQPESATDPCPRIYRNCIRTTWTAPAGTMNVASSVLEILSSYPQAGQAGVDKGGWKIVGGDLEASGKTKLEYTSGTGMLAKLLNRGKPFIDDLLIEVNKNVVEMRSSSRQGQTDFGVNKKRLKFLASKARALGWEAPDPKYCQ